MKKGIPPMFTETDVEHLLRDVGKPLAPELKKRIMDKVREQEKEMQAAREKATREKSKEKEKDHDKGKGR